MPLKFLFLFAIVFDGKLTWSQQIDLEEFSTTLGDQDIPIRVPPSHFKFNKDRTSSGISKRIIGGDIATPHEYPFQVALYIYVYVTLYFCGGSLITPRWVLTAAHCTDSATSIIVVLGSHDLSVEEDSRLAYNTSEYINHADWNLMTIQNDVALIKLPETVAFNDYIGIISVAGGSNSYTGVMSRCLGWGRTILGSLSDVLRYVDAEVISNENCSSYEDYEPYIVGQHLCTSGEGIVGSCNGDSGGPLIVDNFQIGIVSFGATDCAAGLPSVYTRLTDFYDWINETIESYESTQEDENDNNTAARTIDLEMKTSYYLLLLGLYYYIFR